MAVETLRPNATGDEENITGEYPSVPHWQNVDDISPDGTSTMIWSSNSNYQRDLYNIQNHSVGSGTIDYIKVIGFFVSPVSPDQNSIRLSIKSGSTDDDGDTQEAPQYWTYRYEIWTTNPATSAAWTWEEIDSLQIGCCIREPQDGESYETYCTSIYVEVYYTPPPAIELSASDGFKTGDSILTGGTSSLTATDGLVSGDVVIGARVYTNVATDGLKLSDLNIIKLIRNLSCLDGVVPSDIPLSQLGYNLLSSDRISMGDTPLTNIDIILILTDGSKLGDQTSANDIFEQLAADGFNFGEVMIDNLIANSSIIDAIKIGDLGSSGLSFFNTVTDGSKIGDSPSAGSAFYLTTTDGLILSETLVIILNLDVLIADGVSLSDALDTLLETYPSLASGLTLSEHLLTWGGVSKARLTIGTMNRTRIQVTLQGGGT